MSQIRLLVSRSSFLRIHLPTPQALRSQGASGFLALGPKGIVAIPELGKLLEDRSDPSIGQLVAWVLTKFNDESVIPVLVRATTNHNPEVRKTVMVELGYRRRSAEGVVQSLLDGLTDQDAEVRAAATFALGKFPNEADLVVPALVLHLQDLSSTVQGMAASSLGALGETAKAAVPALMEIIQRQGPRCSAASALRVINPDASPKAGLAPMLTPPSFE